MKSISELSQTLVEERTDGKLIHGVQDVFVIRYFEEPIGNTQVVCPICSGNIGMDCLIDPSASDERVWFCIEPDCMALVARSRLKAYQPTAKFKRSLEWPLFCEMNNLGDLVHDVTFEKIVQSSGKIDYLLKFASNPQGIIFMQGGTSTGKTYASLGVCELFTRNNSSCLFYTHDRLANLWLSTFKKENPVGFRERVMEVCLLVIDDFGTGEPSAGFMQFLMELLNVRLQWRNRGTIISTNLNDKDFSAFCGEALTARIMTGQKFEFKDGNRREKIIL